MNISNHVYIAVYEKNISFLHYFKNWDKKNLTKSLFMICRLNLIHLIHHPIHPSLHQGKDFH